MLRRLLYLFLLVIPFSTSYSSEIGGTAAGYSVNGNYVLLSNDKSLASQMKMSNTTYVVRNVFDLGGASVKIPSNCVLIFEGGIIRNGSISMNMTFLDGRPQFENISFSGEISNGLFDCTWIRNGDDIGAKINYAQRYFKKIYTPYCDYDVKTPIELTNMKAVELNSSFHYVGPIQNGKAALNIEKTTNATIKIHSLSIEEKRIDHTDERKVNFIGVALTSCNNCMLYMDNVAFFNENIRLQDRYAIGCSYNRIVCLNNLNANMGVRFYATDYNKKKSWANETVIQGGRFVKYGSSYKYGNKYGVFIGGPKCDPKTYATGDIDTQDASSHITIEDASFDRFDYIAYARNTKNLSIVRCREEEVTTSLCKFDGQCLDFYYIPGYINFINSIDLTDCKRYSMNFKYQTVVDVTSPGTKVQNPQGLVFADKNNIHKKYVNTEYMLEKGVILDTRNLKQFNVQPYGGEGSIGSIIGKMLSDDGNTVLTMGSQKNSPVNNPGRYDSLWNGFVEGWTYVIPENVNKVFVGVNATNAPKLKSFVILSNKEQVITRDNFSIGTFKDRPAKMQEGVGYYATDLHKLIFYDYETASWYDASGNKL